MRLAAVSIVLGIIVGLGGCAGGKNYMGIRTAIENQHAVAKLITVGDPKSIVLPALINAQLNMIPITTKPIESFYQDGKLLTIFFARTGWVPDNLTTDDEFTPYVFADDTLIGIGWTAIGGPKTRGSAAAALIQSMPQGPSRSFFPKSTTIQPRVPVQTNCHKMGNFVNCTSQ